MARNAALDVLKIVMAAMVVGIHTRLFSETSPALHHLTAEGLFRVAVPTFTLISGYYFHDTLMSSRAGAWLRRVGVLYVFWMLVYAPFWLNLDASLRGVLGNIKTILVGHYHLWYISGVMVAALMLIPLRKWNTPILAALALVCLLTGILIQYVGNLHYFGGTLDNILNYSPTHRNFLFLSFPFFCAGFLVKRHDLATALSLESVVIAASVGVALLLAESFYSHASPQLTGSLDNMLALALVCPALLILFLKIYLPGDGKRISAYASGVYFVHPLAVYLLPNDELLFTATLSTSFLVAHTLVRMKESANVFAQKASFVL